jgi:hypothetical protein
MNLLLYIFTERGIPGVKLLHIFDNLTNENYFLLSYRDSLFARSVSKLQKENLKNSFETAALPEGFLSGDEPTPEIGRN